MKKHKILVLCVIFIGSLIPNIAQTAPSRKPIKFYCNLIKKSKILFWNYETTRSVQIDIYDGDKDGEYDTYKWWEDGAVRHKGDFSNNADDSVCEKRLGQLARRNLVAYYSDKDDEYFIKFKSKKDNSNLGFLIIDTEFKKTLKFERYYESYIRGIFVPYKPSKGTLRNHMYLNFKVDRKKNKLRKTNLYIRYKDKHAIKTYDRYEDHRIIISDINNDGVFDECMYAIDHCDYVIAAEFIYNITSSDLLNKFYHEILNNDIKVIELIDGKYRVPLHSRRENFVIGFLDFKSYGDFSVTYCDVTSFFDPNISTAAKFGLCHPSTPYFEFTSFAGREPGFLDPHLRRYRSNIFINEYLEERERSPQFPQVVDVFSLAGDL